ncbi:MAG: hypothetical protein SGI77_02090, partial [Pirellulaceae bacterium]|nr:hypothetical protein [Pirellulaceae bacterium]
WFLQSLSFVFFMDFTAKIDCGSRKPPTVSAEEPKEKEKPDGKTIIGGGPPALGSYTSNVAYILHKEGGRNDDLMYVAKAAGILSGYVRNIDAELSDRLKQKTDKCIYSQIIPAQEADGFWHYSLSDNDPNDKDILGYFMLTTNELMDLQQFNPIYREEKLNAAVKKAQAFSLKGVVPMTEPNTGSANPERVTKGTAVKTDRTQAAGLSVLNR